MNKAIEIKASLDKNREYASKNYKDYLKHQIEENRIKKEKERKDLSKMLRTNFGPEEPHDPIYRPHKKKNSLGY